MRKIPLNAVIVVPLMTCFLGPWASGGWGQTTKSLKDERSDKADSYRYYGPNGLWKKWHEGRNKEVETLQRLGRDTWIHWTWGNQKLLRRASVMAGNLPVPISIDLFRLMDSRNRGTRFRDLGLINEPNCEKQDRPDEFGFYLDRWRGDPYHYYPGDPEYLAKYPYTSGTTPVFDQRHFGRPTGIVGLRLFDNPQFTPQHRQQWLADKDKALKEYFHNPGKVEPPYLVGFSCAFCHIAFDPNNPPHDPENPHWENLAANIGNQYFREGDIMFGKGRIVYGNKGYRPNERNDPYQTTGLTERDFLYHYAATQQPGTSETSRISYDFINNPNTINPIFGLSYRPGHWLETTPSGVRRKVWHVLKDGADSVGVEWALMRVPINIGCEGDYWIDHLFDPMTGRRSRPVQIAELLVGLPDADKQKVTESLGVRFDHLSKDRVAELRARYRSPYGNEEFGQDLQEAWRRIPALASYLLSYEAQRMPQAVDAGKVQRGATVFGKACASCHSSRQPTTKRDQDDPKFFEWSVTRPLFRYRNFLADEVRYPVTKIGTNMARALATNAIDGDVWAPFSSQEYKALAPVGRITRHVPVFPPEEDGIQPPPIRIDFDAPGGGRGYYRTPSLIGMWATAPYLHNNSVGDYYVVFDDKEGTRGWVSVDGTLERRPPEDSWKPRNASSPDYRIDTSVAGRLRMFEDGMRKLLNPEKRPGWVKRTSQESYLIPDLENTARQLVTSIIRQVLRTELRAWLRERQVIPAHAEQIIALIDRAAEEPTINAVRDLQSQAEEKRKRIEEILKKTADDVFEQTVKNLQKDLSQKARELTGKALPEAELEKVLERLRDEVKPEFQDRVKVLHEDLREATVLKVPKGTPVNLYANLNPNALAHAVLAHFRLRHDPRALAEALLRMSDCPDLVEDIGHAFGKELPEKEKDDLIEFLKTL